MSDIRPRQAGGRHTRDLADAAALRTAQRQHAARRAGQQPLSRGLTTSACRPTPARGARRAGEWWEDFALGDEDERVALLQAVRDRQGPRQPCGAARQCRPMRPPPTCPPATRRRRRRRRAAQAGRRRRRCIMSRWRPPGRLSMPARPARASSAWAPTWRCAGDRARGAAGLARPAADAVGGRSSLYRSRPVDAVGRTTSMPWPNCARRWRRTRCCSACRDIEQAFGRVKCAQCAALDPGLLLCTATGCCTTTR